jgi:hypothetical protein
MSWGEDNMEHRRLDDEVNHSGGVNATARLQGRAGNWRSPPRPVEKSAEPGRSYNRRTREVDRRREGGGWARSSNEAG